MDTNGSKTWIIIGIVAAAALIYAGVSGFGKSGVLPKDAPQGAGSLAAGEQKSPEQVRIEELKSRNLAAEPGSPGAPAQSNPIGKEQASVGAVKITMSGAGFLPAAFNVKSGSAVTLAITSNDLQTHIFKFDSPTLSGVAVGLGPQETREISFIAPVRGEYSFYCDVPGHAARGERGTMIVQ